MVVEGFEPSGVPPKGASHPYMVLSRGRMNYLPIVLKEHPTQHGVRMMTRGSVSL